MPMSVRIWMALVLLGAGSAVASGEGVEDPAGDAYLVQHVRLTCLLGCANAPVVPVRAGPSCESLDLVAASWDARTSTMRARLLGDAPCPATMAVGLAEWTWRSRLYGAGWETPTTWRAAGHWIDGESGFVWAYEETRYKDGAGAWASWTPTALTPADVLAGSEYSVTLPEGAELVHAFTREVGSVPALRGVPFVNAPPRGVEHSDRAPDEGALP